jgi:3-hydroxybutyryl-CoA dehydrogenase
VAIKKVGIVSMTGTMGVGIAQVCAQAGYQVVGSSRNIDKVNKTIDSIKARLTKAVDKGTLKKEDMEATVARLKGTTNMQDFADCDLVIEASADDMALKKSIFAELDKICPKTTILATNTSVLSIIDLGVATTRPDKVLGIHFFNPVPLMKLVEIVKTIATSDETAKAAQEFCKSLGKETVMAKDTPGFIVNRLGAPFMLDAVRLLENGVASKEDIDKAVTLALNHPIGPLALLDLIGIDVVYAGCSSMYEETKNPAFAPPVLMKKMIAANWLGRKTGKGFYDYK